VALSAQRVRSKTRNAVRRREDQIEQDEIESGELNLIPYLDMVTNLMLFLLASVATGIVFTQIDTQLPDHAPPSSSVTPPPTNPDDQPLKLFVSIKRDNLILWSVSGLEGTLQQPKDVIGRTGRDGTDCDGGYMCESGYCSDARTCGTPPPPALPPQPTPVFDYRKLNNDLFEIANRRYAGKQRKADTYQIVLQASPEIPFATIASVMAAMRCKMPDFGNAPVGCALPTDDPGLHAAKDPISPDKTLFDTTRAAYDPKSMALFSDILFSAGFE
jgi:biopolymer transport protein ExbD